MYINNVIKLLLASSALAITSCDVSSKNISQDEAKTLLEESWGSGSEVFLLESIGRRRHKAYSSIERDKAIYRLGDQLDYWTHFEGVSEIFVKSLPKGTTKNGSDFTIELYDWSVGEIVRVRSITHQENSKCDAEVTFKWKREPKNSLGVELLKTLDESQTACLVKLDTGWSVRKA